MQINTTISAGQRLEFFDRGDFLRILSATNNLTVEFYKNGVEVAEASNIGAGYAEKFAEWFDKIAITSDTTQAIQVVIRLGNDVRYDTPPNGNVTIIAAASTFTNTQKTVTTTSATIVAANAGRRYLMIQNNDATGDIFVRLDGVTATAATGIKISASGSLELQNLVPSTAITAIGNIASNANIVVVEA